MNKATATLFSRCVREIAGGDSREAVLIRLLHSDEPKYVTTECATQLCAFLDAQRTVPPEPPIPPVGIYPPRPMTVLGALDFIVDAMAVLRRRNIRDSGSKLQPLPVDPVDLIDTLITVTESTLTDEQRAMLLNSTAKHVGVPVYVHVSRAAQHVGSYELFYTSSPEVIADRISAAVKAMTESDTLHVRVALEPESGQGREETHTDE